MSRLRIVPFFAAIKILPGGRPPFLRIIRLEWISSPLENFPPFMLNLDGIQEEKWAEQKAWREAGGASSARWT
jgi:hypothetical protein